MEEPTTFLSEKEVEGSPSPASPSRSRSRSRRRSYSPVSRSSSSSGSRSRSRSWSRSRSRSLSPDRWFLQPAAPLPVPPPSARETKTDFLYLFFRYMFGPVVYSLYAIDIPYSIPHPPATNPCNQDKEINLKTILPILEFPSEEYPYGICCVQLYSKLYFLGGGGYTRKAKDVYGRDEELALYPPNLYILDTSTITTTTTSDHPSQLLTEGPSMKTGKPHTYAFVADGKIYAIAGYNLCSNDTNLLPFEVFDPVSNQWTTLANPPMNCNLKGHTTIKSKVFLVNRHNEIYCYDVEHKEWVMLLNHFDTLSPISNRAEFVEDTLYGFHCQCLAALCPPSSSDADTDADADAGDCFGLKRGMSQQEEEAEDCLRMFKEIVYLSPDMLKHHLGVFCQLPHLVHLGNRTFCHVLSGNPPKTDKHDLKDFERCNISITIFQAFKDTYTEPSSEGVKFFRAEFLYSAHFVATRKPGALPHTRNCNPMRCFFISSAQP